MSASAALDPRRRAIALLAVLALVWGTNWPLFPLAVQEVSVWTFRGFSMLVAGGLLLIIARARGQSLVIPRSHWPLLVFASWAYLMVWNVASAYAAVWIPSGQAALLGFTMPLWAAAIAWALWREPITPRTGVALALGACGVGLLLWRGADAYAQAPLGLACGLLAAVGWAVGTLAIKRGSLQGASIPATVLTGWQLLIAAVPVALMALWRAHEAGQGWFVPSGVSLLVIGYITLVPMGLGNVVWFSIVGLLPGHVAGMGSIAVPIVAMLAGAWVHAEPLGAVQWAAMGCCAAGLWLSLPQRSTSKP